MGLIVLGLQQSARVGLEQRRDVGVHRRRGRADGRVHPPASCASPIRCCAWQIFRDRGFAVDTAVLGLMSIVFVPFFFFASVYSQVSLGETSSQRRRLHPVLLHRLRLAAQIGGRILDRRGARPAVVGGSVLGAVGFYLLAHKLTDLSLSAQRPYIIMAGAGMGLMLGTASTDAVNRAPATSYSEVTGITQTARNFGATLGLAILGRGPHQPQRDQRHRRADQVRRPAGGRPQGGELVQPPSAAGSGQRGSRRRSSTTSSSPSRTRPRRSSTSWPASWRHLHRGRALAAAWARRLAGGTGARGHGRGRRGRGRRGRVAGCGSRAGPRGRRAMIGQLSGCARGERPLGDVRRRPRV